MTVVVAPDSFKGTYSAAEVATAISAGVREAGVHAVAVPLADGGEGTLEALTRPLGLVPVTAEVSNPWGRPVTATYGGTPGGTAVIETAAAVGLHVPHGGRRDPVDAHTRGVGELIVHAVSRGVTEIVLGLGGSATSDGGAGAIAAIDESIAHCDVTLRLLVDVDHEYLAAARVFAPQKGADAAQIIRIEEHLVRMAAALPADPTGVRGAGAAGGLAGGLWARYGATIESGADFVIEHSGMAGVRAVRAFVTGEGRLDRQSAHGKLVSAVLERAGDTPVHVVVGSVADDLGPFGSAFASITVATSRQEMYAAGRKLGGRLHATDVADRLR